MGRGDTRCPFHWVSDSVTGQPIRLSTGSQPPDKAVHWEPASPQGCPQSWPPHKAVHGAGLPTRLSTGNRPPHKAVHGAGLRSKAVDPSHKESAQLSGSCVARLTWGAPILCDKQGCAEPLMTSMKSHHRPWDVRENVPSPASSQGPCESSWLPREQDACRTPGIAEPRASRD